MTRYVHIIDGIETPMSQSEIEARIAEESRGPKPQPLDRELESIMFEAMIMDYANVTAEHIAGIINQKVIITETINVINSIEALPVPESVKSDLVGKAKMACRNLIDTATTPNTQVAADAKTAMKGKLA